MVPPNHISLLIADGHRAKEWFAGLKRAGLQAQCIPTSGSDAAKGDYWLVVPKTERLEGQRYVSAVLAGKDDLPTLGVVSGPLLWGAGFIVLSLLGLLVAGLLSR